ncbi:heme o synthase [Propylenella binzhouense]|uniref:Protoheme IX farnesyltransferase n=1 Tax=Propylenella binzhouense TaxID=2555902 RepID=A0A964WTZ1_9HYPH|nr:protoheme IX farnesyltransferase [Propylenella binzhouense]
MAFEVTDAEAVDGGEVRDFVALLKPRVMSLVVFTAAVGMLAAPGNVHPVLGVIALLAIAVGAGASGALNMWYDADVDAVMRRTAARPIPAGRIHPAEALGFGLTLAVLSILVLGLAVNWLAAGLLAFTIFFYAVIYTAWLKRWTAQNIVIGGAAGAFPPVIGWAAASGHVTLEPLLMFLIIFTWTPPHFWALALFARDDYARAGIPMMPNVAGDPSTRRQIFAYSILLAPVGLAPWLFGFAGPLYGLAAAALGFEFVRRAFVLLREGDAERYRAAKSLFGFSILYLSGLFAVLLLEALARLWGWA